MQAAIGGQNDSSNSAVRFDVPQSSPSGKSQGSEASSPSVKPAKSFSGARGGTIRLPTPSVELDRQSTYQRLQYQMFLLFDEPSSSLWAKIISIVVLLTIVMSIVVFTLQTMPELSNVDENVWWALDCFASVLFTVEYVIRFWACVAVVDPPAERNRNRCLLRTKRCRFFFAVLNVFDLLAILPFYLDEIMKTVAPTTSTAFLKVLRAMRLIRLFRIFKLGRYSQGMKLMMQALINSAQALWVLFFFIILGVILFSSAVYYMERLSCKIWPSSDIISQNWVNSLHHSQDQWGDPLVPGITEAVPEDEAWEMAEYVRQCERSMNGFTETGDLCCNPKTGAPLSFPSIVAAFWWSIVTMTTVGYGDVVPRTPQGMVVGAFCMLLGILLIALPVAIVGSKFQEVYQAMETETQDQQLELSEYSQGPTDYEDPVEDNLASLVKNFDMANVHPMLQRQVTSLISLVDNASNLQRRLAHYHQREEDMHEELQTEFEAFITKIKQAKLEQKQLEEQADASAMDTVTNLVSDSGSKAKGLAKSMTMRLGKLTGSTSPDSNASKPNKV